jgi:hypothetical protein
LLVQKSYARIEPLTAAIRDENAKFVMVRELSNLREDDLRKLSVLHLRAMLSAYQAAKAEAAKVEA